MMKKLIPIIVIAFMIFNNACRHDKNEFIQPAIPDTLQIDSSVSYLNDIKPLLITYCLGDGVQKCHVTNTNQGANGDFSTYVGLKDKVDNGSLEQRAIISKDMPPPSTTGPATLAAADLHILKSWIAIGAPNN